MISNMVRKVLYWCAHHRGRDASKENRTCDAASWEREFSQISESSAFDILLTASCLVIKNLCEMCCQVIANLTRRGSHPETRRLFNVPSQVIFDLPLYLHRAAWPLGRASNSKPFCVANASILPKYYVFGRSQDATSVTVESEPGLKGHLSWFLLLSD
ncbi:S phase kinase associated protein SKR 1 [Echinococcus multilocularis]|uniref:S phase kinase associated protein SKR 1 n=1 Tax=Echinococcus multilocularis TaxID=6211 RepID=A0A068YI28_ECHMU|nr:S phase kinase associated protein SKR 1 [Echinococcus multilocularis]